MPAAAQPSRKPGAAPTSAPAPASSAAAAAGVSKAGARTEAELDALYKAAVRAMKSGKYGVAYEKFKIVWEADRTPTTAGNLGSAELKLKKYPEAAEHLQIFLREEKDLDPDERKEAEGELAQAKAQVVTLRVEVPDPGTEILIDGQLVGTSPIDHDLFVTPTPHLIIARKGEATAQIEIDDGPGSVQKVRLEPKAPVKPPPPPPPPPPPKPFPARTVLLVGGGIAAAAGLGVGIGTGVASLVKQGEQDRCMSRLPAEQEPCWLAADPERQSLAAFSTGGFIVGGAGVATLAYLLFSRGNEPVKSGRTIQVIPAGTGVLISGTW